MKHSALGLLCSPTGSGPTAILEMENTNESRRLRATAMTKDKLPTTQYNMYNKVECLGAWRQLLDFYGCEDNFKYKTMPDGYDEEMWRRGHSTANVLPW
jgi:hypothetical protein